MQYRRILTALAVALVSLAVAVPVATATQSQGSLHRERLQEIGAWAVPSTTQSGPSLAEQRALVRERLQEIGSWAVPSTPAASSSSGTGFDWQHAGLALALAAGALLFGIAGLVSMRRHPPVVQ